MPSWFWGVLRIVSTLAMIGVLLVVTVACLCAMWYIVGLATRYLPLVGNRHKHTRWTELNADGGTLPRPTNDPSNEEQHGR